MEQNIPMFWGKTSGCFGERHPDVLHIKSYTVRGSNQTLFLPQYQYFQKFRLCVRHALVLKNCLLLSSVCLPTSWVQMYALFWDYANR